MSGIINSVGSKSGIIGVGANQPCFLVTGNGATTTSMLNNNETLINFETVEYVSAGGIWASATDRWTPINGSPKYYSIYVIGGLATGTNANRFEISVRKNNSTLARTMGINDEDNVYTLSTMMELDGVDDYIDVWFRHNTGDTTSNCQTPAYFLQFGAFAISG